MKKITACVSSIVAIVFIAGCSSFLHNENKAAKSAIQFAKVAIIKHDIQKGYALLSESARKTISLQQYAGVMFKMHPTAYPLSLTADEFEPMQGQKGMNIFLHGENGTEQFYYRLEMEGNFFSGYKASGIYRSNGPYPAAKTKQKLETTYSTQN